MPVRRCLILASQSPRRADLLRGASYAFTSVLPKIRELTTSALSLRELTLINALRKGRDVLSRSPAGSVVLAADTLVGLDGGILGKPETLIEAREMLRSLSGRTHEVYTSVFIGEQRRGFIAFTEHSEVTFRRLSDAGIAKYFARVNPLGKAGAYGAQERGSEIIARIEGSPSNVAGLPMKPTVRALALFGIAFRPQGAVAATSGFGSIFPGAGSRRRTW